MVECEECDNPVMDCVCTSFDEFQEWTRTEMTLEIKRLRELWNIAYGYGVRVHVDAVTGEISSHYLEERE